MSSSAGQNNARGTTYSDWSDRNIKSKYSTSPVDGQPTQSSLNNTNGNANSMLSPDLQYLTRKTAYLKISDDANKKQVQSSEVQDMIYKRAHLALEEQQAKIGSSKGKVTDAGVEQNHEHEKNDEESDADDEPNDLIWRLNQPRSEPVWSPTAPPPRDIPPKPAGYWPPGWENLWKNFYKRGP